jgi:hypothetical protein
MLSIYFTTYPGLYSKTTRFLDGWPFCRANGWPRLVQFRQLNSLAADF